MILRGSPGFALSVAVFHSRSIEIKPIFGLSVLISWPQMSIGSRFRAGFTARNSIGIKGLSCESRADDG
jgi:hypothetical protein